MSVFKYILSSNLVGIRSLSTCASKWSKLSGKVAIVTASTEGIGFSIAKRLCEDGAKVVVSSRREENVEKAVQQLKDASHDCMGVVCHVGEQEHRTSLIKKTIEKYGGVDILVSNAAANPAFGPMLDTNEAQWEKIFEINVKAAFLLTKEIVPHIEERGGGSIIYVSSVAAYQPLAFLGPYSVSKTALLGLTKALAPELALMNIRVNGVAPGVIRTKFSKALYENPDIAERLFQNVNLKRIGEPDEMGGIVSFLASDDASYITGETIPVTGGMHTRL